jgi:hypothetical protein
MSHRLCELVLLLAAVLVVTGVGDATSSSMADSWQVTFKSYILFILSRLA